MTFATAVTDDEDVETQLDEGGGGGACVTDTFNRTVSAGGLGTSDAGIAWSTPTGSYTSGWSANGSRGLHTFPSITAAFLQWFADIRFTPPAQSPATDVRFQFELSTFPDTTHGAHFLRVSRLGLDGGADVSFVGQAASGGNTVTIFSGSGSTSAGVTITGVMNARIWFGTTVMVKVWPDGDTEPEAWLVTRTLSGTYTDELEFAHWQTLADASTPSYVSTLYLNDLDIDGIPGSNCPEAGGVTDSFNRPDSATLGTSDVGAVWDDGTEGDGTVSILNNEARWFLPAVPSGGPGGGQSLESTLPLPALTQDFNVRFKVRWVSAHTGGSTDFQDMVLAVRGGTRISRLTFFHGNAAPNGLQLSATGSGFSSVLSFTVTEGVDYYVRLEQVFGSTLRCRVWLASDPEPGTWTHTLSTTAQTAWNGTGSVLVNLAQVSGTPAETVDAMDFRMDELLVEGIVP